MSTHLNIIMVRLIFPFSSIVLGFMHLEIIKYTIMPCLPTKPAPYHYIMNPVHILKSLADINISKEVFFRGFHSFIFNWSISLHLMFISYKQGLIRYCFSFFSLWVKSFILFWGVCMCVSLSVCQSVVHRYMGDCGG